MDGGRGDEGWGVAEKLLESTPLFGLPVTFRCCLQGVERQ